MGKRSKKSKKLTITPDDYIKANKIARRAEEIQVHGRPVSVRRVHKSKKIYDRKKNKADAGRSPYLFVI